jgi:hypothetical protein
MKAPISIASRVRPNQRVLFQKLDQEAVLLHLDSGIYFGLDRVGMDIWMQLADSNSLQEVAQNIAGRYTVSKEQSEQDLIGLIEKLLEHGLVAFD